MAKQAAPINPQEDVGVPVGDLKQITELAAKLVASAANIKKLEDALQLAKLEHEELELITIPEAMMAAGLKKFTLTSGEIIEAAPYIRGNIPSISALEKADEESKSEMINRREAAFAWLRANNSGTLIKNQLTVEFGKGQNEVAKKMLADVLSAGLKAKCEESVHWSTLNAYIKECLTKGIDIPFDTFAIFSGHKAVIKQAK
jgi:hypothetical protein